MPDSRGPANWRKTVRRLEQHLRPLSRRHIIAEDGCPKRAAEQAGSSPWSPTKVGRRRDRVSQCGYACGCALEPPRPLPVLTCGSDAARGGSNGAGGGTLTPVFGLQPDLTRIFPTLCGFQEATGRRLTVMSDSSRQSRTYPMAADAIGPNRRASSRWFQVAHRCRSDSGPLPRHRPEPRLSASPRASSWSRRSRTRLGGITDNNYRTPRRARRFVAIGPSTCRRTQQAVSDDSSLAASRRA